MARLMIFDMLNLNDSEKNEKLKHTLHEHEVNVSWVKSPRQ